MIFINRFTTSAHKKKLLRAVALLLCASLALTGCKPVETVEFTAAVEIRPGATDAAAVPQGELYTSIPANLTSLHPLAAKTEDLVNLLGLVFEPAIRIEADGTFSGCLVESWTTEGNIYTFTVRKGVSFHGNHGDLTANDLKYTIDLIKTLSATNVYNIDGSAITSCEVADDYTLKVTAAVPSNKVLYFMNFPVLCKSYYQDKTVDTMALPVGTGPYTAEAFSSSDGMTFAVNEKWWRKLPSIKTIYAKPYGSSADKLEAFKVSVLDLITTQEHTSHDLKINGKSDVTNYTTQFFECIVPNHTNRWLGNKTVRQAISAALDRRNLVTTGVLGQGVSAEVPIKPDSRYSLDSGVELCVHDLAKAKRLLSDAGVDMAASPVTFSLIACEASDIYYRETLANAIAKQLSELGITLNVEMLSETDYRTRLTSGEFDLALCEFYMRKDMDISFLTSETANYGHISAAALTPLISAVNIAPDSASLQSAYTALITALKDELPVIGLYYRCGAVAFDSNVSGIKSLSNLDIFANINDWTFDIR